MNRAKMLKMQRLQAQKYGYANGYPRMQQIQNTQPSGGCGCNKNTVIPSSNPCGCTPPAPIKPVVCCPQTPSTPICPPKTICPPYRLDLIDAFDERKEESTKCLQLCGDVWSALIFEFQVKLGALQAKMTEKELIDDLMTSFSITESGETKICDIPISMLQQMTEECFGHKLQVRGKIESNSLVKVDIVFYLKMNCNRTVSSYCDLLGDYGFAPSGCNSELKLKYPSAKAGIVSRKVKIYALYASTAPQYRVEFHKTTPVNLEQSCFTGIKLDKQGKIRDLWLKVNKGYDEGITSTDELSIAEIRFMQDCNQKYTKNDCFGPIDLFQNTSLGEKDNDLHYLFGCNMECMPNGGCDSEIQIKTLAQGQVAEILYSIIR